MGSEMCIRDRFNALRLRRKRYDLSITAFPSNKRKFALLAGLVGARERIAHSYPECSGAGLDWIYSRLVPAERGLHDIEQNLRLLGVANGRREDLPRPILHLSEQDEKAAEDYWSRIRPGYPVVGIHPGSGNSPNERQTAKRWPLENFCEVIRIWARERGATALVFCGPSEADLRGELMGFAKREGLQDVYFPSAEIRTVAALIKRCACFLSGDTGLMHVATAVHTPVVALHGPTDPARAGPPWDDCAVLRGKALPCRPCLKYPQRSRLSAIHCRQRKCWEGLPPGDVVDALSQKLMLKNLI